MVYGGGSPRLGERRLVLGSRDLPFRCTLETQNFRPPEALARRQEGLGSLTYFNKDPGSKASNPVVIDGRLMAFKIARSSDPAGVDYGIVLHDFSRAASRH